MTAVIDTDVAIIGAGPVGLFAVFECGMLRMKSVVIDALEDVGGQCTALYPEKPIYDIPAHPAIAAAELIAQLETDRTLRAGGAGRRVDAGAGRRRHHRHLARRDDPLQAVIIAAGAGASGRTGRRSMGWKATRPPAPSATWWRGGRDARQARGDRRRRRFRGLGAVAEDVAAKVTVVHRRPKFRAAPRRQHSSTRRRRGGEWSPYQLRAEGRRRGAGSGDGNTPRANATFRPTTCWRSSGFRWNGPIADWGLGLERSHIAVEPATCATNVDGVYAIGDIATYPGS